MGQLSDTRANAMLDAGLPATVYVGLSSTTPTVAGASVTEPSGNGYARIAITLDAAAARERSNTAAIQFEASGGDWDSMTHSVYYTALTGGDFIGFDDLDATRNMVNGATLDFAIGAIDFGL